MSSRQKSTEPRSKVARSLPFKHIDLKNVDLDEFKRIVASSNKHVVWDNISNFLENVHAENNTADSIAYLKNIFKTTHYFILAKSALSKLLLGFIRDGNTSLFKFHVNIYNPNLMKYVIEACYSGDELTYDLFAECSSNLLKFIFVKMKKFDDLESFWDFYGSGTKYPKLNVMYDQLFRRENSELLRFIDEIISNGMDGNFYTDYVNTGNRFRHLQKYLKVSLENDDLVIADFICEKFSIAIFEYLEFFHIKELLKEICEQGKLTTLKYIFKKELFDINQSEENSILELISIACKNGHLNIAKYLFRKAGEKDLVYDVNTMSVVYRKTMEEDHVDAGEWLLENFEIIDVAQDEEEIWDVDQE